MEEFRLLKTGIPGLDNLLRGGIPEKAIILVSGPPGIGKSNLGLQYVYNGIREYDEPGIYLSVEYSGGEVKKYCRNFGWDLNALEAEGKLAILEQDLISESGGEKNKKENKDTVLSAAKRIGAKRITLDSITLFNYMFDDLDTRRLHVLKFFSLLKKLGLTAIIISEQYGIWPHIETDPNHFLADGLIELFWTSQRGQEERCIRVAKMRGQEIDTTIRPFKISSEGVRVHHDQVPFTLQEG